MSDELINWALSPGSGLSRLTLNCIEDPYDRVSFRSDPTGLGAAMLCMERRREGEEHSRIMVTLSQRQLVALSRWVQERLGAEGVAGAEGAAQS